MKRRNVIKTTAYGTAAAATASLAACAQSSSPTGGGAIADGAAGDELPKIDWQMATSWPAALDTILGGATTFADRISAMSGGRFTPHSAL